MYLNMYGYFNKEETLTQSFGPAPLALPSKVQTNCHKWKWALPSQEVQLCPGKLFQETCRDTVVQGVEQVSEGSAAHRDAVFAEGLKPCIKVIIAQLEGKRNSQE